MGGHGEQVHHPLEGRLLSDGNLDGHRPPVEAGLDRVQRPLERGALAVELGDHEDPGDGVFLGEPEHALGDDLDPGHRLHQQQG